jgi:hypothetical protein
VFAAVVKRAINSNREAPRLLDRESADGPPIEHILPLIRRYHERAFDDLKLVCGTAFELVGAKLLPAALESAAVVFFRKFQGDAARYIAEFADGPTLERAKRDAEETCTAALDAATACLAPADPVRLGTILNFAVFRYEHRGIHGEAAEALEAAIAAADEGFDQMSKGSKTEAKEVVAVMQQNLKAWGRPDSIAFMDGNIFGPSASSDEETETSSYDG